VSTPNPVEVIAHALAKHPGGARVVSSGENQLTVMEYVCGCGWREQSVWANGPRHPAHLASVIAALPNIAIVPRMEAS